MSENTQRLPIAEAKAIADELVALLAPSCRRIEVCGSIRRQAKTVGDIDLVAIPETATLTTSSTPLFGDVEDTRQIDVLAHTLSELCGQQVIHQGRKSNGALMGWGPRLKHGVYREMKIQVQSVDPENLGMWMVIRTGPHAYSQGFVTARGRKAAIRNYRTGDVEYRPGTLPPGYEIKDGFRLYRDGVFVPTPEEADVYRTLGFRYREPRERR